MWLIYLLEGTKRRPEAGGGKGGARPSPLLSVALVTPTGRARSKSRRHCNTSPSRTPMAAGPGTPSTPLPARTYKVIFYFKRNSWSLHKCQPGRRSKKKKVYITYQIPPSSLVLLLAFPFPSWTIIRQQNFPDTRQHYTGRLNCKPTSKEGTDRVPQPFSCVASYPANCWVLTRHTHQKYGKLDKIQIPGPHLETHRGDLLWGLQVYC